MFDAIFSWYTLWWIILPVYVVCCVGLIVIVLLQKGKGTGFAGAFGVGAGSETVFGPRARKSLPVRLTYIMAGLFMFFSLSMSLLVGKIIEGTAPAQVVETAEEGQSNALDQLFGPQATGGTPPLATAPAELGVPAEITEIPAETAASGVAEATGSPPTAESSVEGSSPQPSPSQQ
ncbi:MAG: hypothetical protein AMXMBFR4_01630 [Candidatus Hydrogenedentota bacterium]